MVAWQGKVATDIRDSVPDWAPYVQPRAPEGSPNILYVVWDDVGYGAMDVHGGPIETPTIAQDRRTRPAFHELSHHSPVLADPFESAQRPQRDQQQHGVHHRGGVGVTRVLGPDSVRERLDLRGSGRTRLEHVRGREVAPHAG